MLTGKKWDTGCLPAVCLKRPTFDNRDIQKNLGIGLTNFLSHNFVMPVPILACLVLKCSWWFTLSAAVKLLLIMQIMTSSEVKRSRTNYRNENLPISS